MAFPQPTPEAQPKIVQKLLVRTAITLLALGTIFVGIRYFQSFQGDFDKGGESAGMIAAIRLERDGQQAVLIKPDGTIVGTKSWKEGVTDREPAWAPDGRFLFFCSDRKENTFNVFRWNPQTDDAQARTSKGSSRSNPTFAPDDTEGLPLITMGGFVRELEPATGKTLQILPPSNSEIVRTGSGDDEGTSGSLAIYGNLGNSFRIARYLPGKRGIVAVMRRDEGESLVYQSLTPGENGKIPRPKPIAAGSRIDFDIDPTSGTVAFSVLGFSWLDKDQIPPQFRKGNRITTPFRNMVGLLDTAKGEQSIVAASPDDADGLGSPRVSPDGTRMLLIQGKVEDGNLRPVGLLTLPLRTGGIQQASPLVQGEVYEPSWAADGKRIIYAKRVGGKRDLFTMGADGSDEKNLTNGKGDFMSPLFSPTTKG